MIRRRKLDQALDAALAPVRADIADLTDTVHGYHVDAATQLVTRVADAEQRVTAATAQADARARLDADRHAAQMAAVHAELAAKVEETALVPWRELRRERDQLADHLGNTTRRLAESEGRERELERRLELVTVERDEARRQHDEARADAQLLGDRLVEVADDNVALEVRCSALADLCRRAVPKVAAKTTRLRYQAELAALARPPDDEIELADTA